MRPARIITAVAFSAAIAITGCSTQSTPTNPSPAPQPPGTAPSLDPAPTTKPPPGAGSDIPTSTPSPPGGRPAPAHCAASALRGSVQGSDGAAGHIWYTIQLRNASTRTCTLRGIPQVRLLGAQGQPVTAPSVPGGPGGSLVVLRPGAAARFSFSEPNACDGFVAGSRLRVTLPASQGSLVVPLGTETRFGTCASVGVQAMEASTAPTTPTTPRFDRISDPQVAADRLVAAWVGGDRAAAGKLTTSRAVTDRLFSESPPAERPAVLPCRLVADLAVFVCSYPVAERAELSLFVEGGASAGYSVSGVEFGD